VLSLTGGRPDMCEVWQSGNGKVAGIPPFTAEPPDAPLAAAWLKRPQSAMLLAFLPITFVVQAKQEASHD
jgi:hypothetical protein